MFHKYLIGCLINLLIFNYATGRLLQATNSNGVWKEDDAEVSSDEMFLDLEDNIVRKLDNLTRLEGLIIKGNDESEAATKKFAAIEERIRKLDDKIMRMLDIIEKVPESFEKINQRLDAMGNAPKIEEQVQSLKNSIEILPDSLSDIANKLDLLAQWNTKVNLQSEATFKITQDESRVLKKINDRLDSLESSVSQTTVGRSPSKKSDQDLRHELEGMVYKQEKDFVASNKLYNEKLLKTEITDLDALDNSTINETDCKYLSLKNQEIQVYQVDNGTTSLITMAYHQLSTYRHIRRVDFETHVAIRSADNVYILLWHTKPDLSGSLNPDYEIGLGARDSSNEIISTFKTKYGDTWRESTPDILSPDQYKKFYIKTYGDSLEIGSRCDETPLHVHNTHERGHIAAIGFLSTSMDGAKVLLDCPATTCADIM